MKHATAGILIFLLHSLSSAGQNSFTYTAAAYFRVDPFAGTFSAFVNALTTDSALHQKEILRQTDTTGFYLRGSYTVFNPFSMDANRVDLLFHESQVAINEKQTFSYYTYQLTAYFPDSSMNRTIIQKDYKKLGKFLRSDLPYTEIKPLKGHQDIEDGEIASYTDSDFPVDPATVSWQTLGKSKQLALTIILRFRRINNYAYPVNHFITQQEVP